MKEVKHISQIMSFLSISLAVLCSGPSHILGFIASLIERQQVELSVSFTVPHDAELQRCDEKIPRDEFLGPYKLVWSSLWSKTFTEQVLGFTVTHLGLLGREPLK